MPLRPEVVAAIDRHEGDVYVPARKGFDQAVVDHGVAGVVDGNTVPLDHVPQIRVAALGVALQLRVGRREGRDPGHRDLYRLPDLGHEDAIPVQPTSTSVSILPIRSIPTTSPSRIFVAETLLEPA
jgi:hypothetical protein